MGNEAWILSYREECFEQIGLRPSIKIPVFNGSLECEFRKYTIFEGKLKEFRSEGGVVKTEEEKAAMAEKHRFKKNREFKQRLEEEASNEEGDIRTFTFHHHRIESFQREDEKPRRRTDNDRRFRDSDRRDGGDRRQKGGNRREGDFRKFKDGGRRFGDKDRPKRDFNKRDFRRNRDNDRRQNNRRDDNED